MHGAHAIPKVEVMGIKEALLWIWNNYRAVISCASHQFEAQIMPNLEALLLCVRICYHWIKIVRSVMLGDKQTE
jgi:predicted RNase H-like nuclease